jgi:hypothetical protein
MSSSEPSTRKPLSLWVVIGIWLLVPASVFIIDQTIRWTDHSRGFLTGLVLSCLMLLASVMYGTPWLLGVAAVYWWRGWRRFRGAWMLAPVMGFTLWVLALLMVQPPTASNRLREVSGVTIPDDARNLRWYYEGATLASGSSDRWYFEASSESIRRCLGELKLTRHSPVGENGGSIRLHSPPGWSDPRQWPGGIIHFSRHAAPESFGPNWGAVTNEPMTRVHLEFSSD